MNKYVNKVVLVELHNKKRPRYIKKEMTEDILPDNLK